MGPFCPLQDLLGAVRSFFCKLAVCLETLITGDAGNILYRNNHSFEFEKVI